MATSVDEIDAAVQAVVSGHRIHFKFAYFFNCHENIKLTAPTAASVSTEQGQIHRLLLIG